MGDNQGLHFTKGLEIKNPEAFLQIENDGHTSAADLEITGGPVLEAEGAVPGAGGRTIRAERHTEALSGMVRHRAAQEEPIFPPWETPVIMSASNR